MLIKIAAVCVPAALMAAVLRRDSPVMAMLIAIAAVCVVAYSALGAFRELSGFMTEVAEASGVGGTVLGVLIRALGIAVIGRLTADLCRDAGLSAAGSAAELAGAAAMLYAALPVMRGVFRLIGELV